VRELIDRIGNSRAEQSGGDTMKALNDLAAWRLGLFSPAASNPLGEVATIVLFELRLQ
jgi:hypothetical protein